MRRGQVRGRHVTVFIVNILGENLLGTPDLSCGTIFNYFTRLHLIVIQAKGQANSFCILVDVRFRNETGQ